MERNLKQLNPLVLAYIGDGWLELKVRTSLVENTQLNVHGLHKQTVSKVCASAQSRAVERILPLLSDEELVIFKRGRNAHSGVPKNANVLEYRRATGLEALFGFLYLKQQWQRLEELFLEIWEESI